MSLPVIDLTEGTGADLAARVDAALSSAGFMAVSGHGVPACVVAAAFDANRRFFALADADKRRWHIDHSAHRRGFDPMGWQSLDPNQPADLKESFYIGVEALGPNQWPSDTLLPDFRTQCGAYTAQMTALSRRLLRLCALALGLARDHFDAFMRNPVCTTRLLHYPPQPGEHDSGAVPGQIGCGAHTDWGALTLLAQCDAGGLQVQMRDGSWLDVPPLPGAFIVNVGDMMQRWTNDRWPSTLHRVVNRHGGRDRHSIAYFCDLDHDACIVPLATCTSATNPARYGPITAGDHLEAMYRRTTVAA